MFAKEKKFLNYHPEINTYLKTLFLNRSQNSIVQKKAKHKLLYWVLHRHR